MVLGGDLLASEYLLLNLISKVHTRQNELILGNISINLNGLDPHKAKLLTNFIRSVTIMTLYIPLSIYSLENTQMNPKKNYDTN